MYEIKKLYIVLENTTWNTLDPEYAIVNEEVLNAYLKENPMPKDPEYSEEDLKNDLLHSSGALTFPLSLRKETIEYIQDLLNEIVL